MSRDIAEMSEAEAAESRSQHLHPLTLLLNLIALIPSLGFAFVALYWTASDNDLSWLLPIIVPVGFAIPMFFNWLAWSRFSYRVGGEDVKIQSGVLARKNRAIPYERIQDVSIEQKIIARLLGLATVKIETGGSGGDEDALDAVSLVEAERLRDIIRDRKAGVEISQNADTAAEPLAAEEEGQQIFAMDARRVFTAGLFNFSFILLAVIGTVAQNLDFLLPGEFFDPRNWAGMWVDQDVVGSFSLGTRILGIAGALVSLIGIGVVSGIVTTFVREHGFRLDRTNNGFRRRRGLFTLTDMVMPIHRVQAAILRTGPVRNRFGWLHLKLQSLASDVSGETDHSAAPCAKAEEIDPILAETKISPPPEDLEFKGVSAASWWRDALLVALLLTAVGSGNGWFVHPALYALPLLALPIAAIMILHWRYHKYALTEKQLFVHSGWWRRKLTILPLHRVQTVDVGQSPFDHPLNLATVTVGVAGGSPIAPLKINDIPVATAIEIRDWLLPHSLKH